MAEHRRDLRHHAAHRHLLAEQVAGLGERRTRRSLDARAGGVEQPDDRDALTQRDLTQTLGLVLTHLTHRAGHHREVVRAHRNSAAIDLAYAGNHAVRREVPLVGLDRGIHRVGELAELDERVRIEEQVDALPDGHLAHRALPLDERGSTHPGRPHSTRGEVLDERLPVVEVRLIAHRRTVPLRPVGVFPCRDLP